MMFTTIAECQKGLKTRERKQNWWGLVNMAKKHKNAIFSNPPNSRILKLRIPNVLIATYWTALTDPVANFVELGHVETCSVVCSTQCLCFPVSAENPVQIKILNAVAANETCVLQINLVMFWGGTFEWDSLLERGTFDSHSNLRGHIQSNPLFEGGTFDLNPKNLGGTFDSNT